MPHELDHRHLKEIVNWLLNLGIVHSLKPPLLKLINNGSDQKLNFCNFPLKTKA
jgi:hypothetical protein